jgi:predicted  nucleic acid-binding Zn-ribbon protein
MLLYFSLLIFYLSLILERLKVLEQKIDIVIKSVEGSQEEIKKLNEKCEVFFNQNKALIDKSFKKLNERNEALFNQNKMLIDKVELVLTSVASNTNTDDIFINVRINYI